MELEVEKRDIHGARDGQRSRSLILIFKITTVDLDLLGEKITSGDLFKLILIFDLQFLRSLLYPHPNMQIVGNLMAKMFH